MDTDLTITFTDISHNELGYVTFDGTTLTPSNQYAKSMVQFYTKRGMSAEDWVIKFSNWSNGRVYAQADDETEEASPPN